MFGCPLGIIPQEHIYKKRFETERSAGLEARIARMFSHRRIYVV